MRMGKEITRRNFLKGAAAGAVSVAAMGVLGNIGDNAGAAPGTVLAPLSGTPINQRVTVELPIVENYERDRTDRNGQTEFETDILVIGGGYAGLNAAYRAKLEGKNVILVDKGRPGYSGQSPWPGTFNYFDPDYDDAEAYYEYIRYASDYFANLDWVKIWMKESKAMKDRIASFGLLDIYPQMFNSDYWQTRDYYGYRDNVVKDHERRPKFVEVLNNNGISWLQHVMITKVIVQNGKCVGAVGFQHTNGDILKFHAKAVILAAGNGDVISTGHPLGDNTFDGEFMAYDLGLPIGGKEFEDFHTHQSFAGGSNWLGSEARFFDPNFLCGGNIVASNTASAKAEAENTTKSATSPLGMPYLDTSPQSMTPPTRASAQSVWYGKAGYDDQRIGKMITPYVRMDAPGAAVGMCLHLSSGVFCGNDDTDGYTGIPGLWVSGDGTHLSNACGAAYNNGNGFTTCFVSICGDHAAKSASAYVNTVALEKISNQNYGEAVEEIEHPLKLETGFSPMWARDCLQGIMGPYWVQKNKSEATLQAALVQVQYMKKNVADRLLARTGHELRMALETKHKIYACELKLLASLVRKESRGNAFFRDDYPDRNDAEWRKLIVYTKGVDGEPVMKFEPLKDEWGPLDTPIIPPPPSVIDKALRAYVTKFSGNQNALTITVTETLSDGRTNIITQTFTINNNAAGTYSVGAYKVYVKTQGNDQIRELYFVE